MRKLPAITGLRGFAALYVLLFHLFVEYSTRGADKTRPFGLNHGWIGVDLFFVLSAFLLSMPFLQRPHNVRDLSAWRGYLIKRWWRIAPPYYVSILLALALAGNLSYLISGGSDVAAHVFYVHTFYLPTFASINPIYWTLGIEFQFYLILPILALAFGQRRWKASVVACVALSIAWRAATYQSGEYSWLTFAPPAFLGHYALGIAAARLYLDGWRSPIPSAYLAPAAALAFIVLPLSVLIPNGGFGQGTENLLADALLRPLVALGFAVVTFSLAGESSLLQALFGSAPMRALGEISYSVYLTQVPVLLFLRAHTSALRLSSVGYALAGLTVALVCAFLFYRLVEKPLLKIRQQLTSRPATERNPMPSFSRVPLTPARNSPHATELEL